MNVFFNLLVHIAEHAEEDSDADVEDDESGSDPEYEKPVGADPTTIKTAVDLFLSYGSSGNVMFYRGSEEKSGGVEPFGTGEQFEDQIRGYWATKEDLARLYCTRWFARNRRAGDGDDARKSYFLTTDRAVDVRAIADAVDNLFPLAKGSQDRNIIWKLSPIDRGTAAILYETVFSRLPDFVSARFLAIEISADEEVTTSETEFVPVRNFKIPGGVPRDDEQWPVICRVDGNATIRDRRNTTEQSKGVIYFVVSRDGDGTLVFHIDNTRYMMLQPQRRPDHKKNELVDGDGTFLETLVVKITQVLQPDVAKENRKPPRFVPTSYPYYISAPQRDTGMLEPVHTAVSALLDYVSLRWPHGKRRGGAIQGPVARLCLAVIVQKRLIPAAYDERRPFYDAFQGYKQHSPWPV